MASAVVGLKLDSLEAIQKQRKQASILHPSYVHNRGIEYRGWVLRMCLGGGGGF